MSKVGKKCGFMWCCDFWTWRRFQDDFRHHFSIRKLFSALFMAVSFINWPQKWSGKRKEGKSCKNTSWLDVRKEELQDHTEWCVFEEWQNVWGKSSLMWKKTSQFHVSCLFSTSEEGLTFHLWHLGNLTDFAIHRDNSDKPGNIFQHYCFLI